MNIFVFFYRNREKARERDGNRDTIHERLYAVGISAFLVNFQNDDINMYEMCITNLF